MFGARKFLSGILHFFCKGTMAMSPFMTLYMRSLGITKEELAFILSFTPILGLLVPPLSGVLADRVGNFKVFLSTMMMSAGISGTLYLAVPQARITHKMPDLLPFNTICSSANPSLKLILEQPYECSLEKDRKEVLVTLQHCQSCGSTTGEIYRENSDSRGYLQTPLTLKNIKNINYTVSIVVMSNKEGIEEDKNNNLDFLESNPSICSTLFDPSVTHSTSRDKNYAPHVPCFTCRLTANRTALCRNKDTVEDINPSATFVIYLLIRFIHVTLISICLTMFSGAVMAVLVEKGGDYGLQRLYMNLGGVIFTPLSGRLIDFISSLHGEEDFRSIFYIFVVMMFLCSYVNQFVDLEFKRPNVNIIRDCKILLKNPEVDVFLFFMIVSGMCSGILESFLFWFLDDLGASKSLMGLTVTVGLLAGIPILAISGWIVDRHGHVVTIIFGFFVLCIRLVGYSLIYNPWQVMPFEALECFSVSLVMAVSATYAAFLSGSDTVATLQGLQQGFHYGVGNGLGNFVAGFLLEPLGTRWTFRLMGFVLLVFCLMYLALYVIFFRTDYLQKFEEEKTKKKNESLKLDASARKKSKESESTESENSDGDV
ncbi:major facilitator superfamily domain-containing protein 6-like protein A isoform X2 [Oratosquilla oratoria]|uniref:major facilitator superfamily domain-containing protein 6-like protein A isoform X2 n=1 Tax=Oratosquilla oratoria TaxID=337810 RepID=UPI003F770C99